MIINKTKNGKIFITWWMDHVTSLVVYNSDKMSIITLAKLFILNNSFVLIATIFQAIAFLFQIRENQIETGGIFITCFCFFLIIEQLVLLHNPNLKKSDDKTIVTV